MAIVLPEFDRYKPDEVIDAVVGNRRFPVEIYLGKGKHTESSRANIGLLHGWLGEYTTGFIASILAQHGHNVFALNQETWPASMQSKIVHAGAKASKERFGKPEIHFMGHSRAVKALVESALHQQDKDPEDLTYVMSSLTTVAGLGTNGESINVAELRKESIEMLKLFGRAPLRTGKILGQSAINLMTRPVPHVLEGLTSISYDARDDMQTISEAGVPVTSVFLDRDFVIHAPREAGTIIYQGSHMTPLVNPEIALDLAS